MGPRYPPRTLDPDMRLPALLRGLRPTPAFWVVVALLLAADAVLIGLYLPYKLRWLTDPAIGLGHDGGYAEVLGYAKTLWVGLCAAALAVRTRQPVYAAFSALFVAFLIDDAAMLHEYWGFRIGEALALPDLVVLLPDDVGEILFVGLWAGPILLLGALGYLRSDAPARHIARLGLVGIAALAAFGVGVDVLHQIVTSGPEINGLHTLMTTIEEGGEMAVMSVLAAGAIALTVATVAGRPAAELSVSVSMPGLSGDGRAHEGDHVADPHSVHVSAHGDA